MIYIASSWKNRHVDCIADCLEQWNIPYYNFKSEGGFHWSMVRPHYATENLSLATYKEMLEHRQSVLGFTRDMDHLDEANKVILVSPCGRSAHLELGYAIGQGKPTAIYFTELAVQPELMYKMVDLLTDEIQELMEWAGL